MSTRVNGVSLDDGAALSSATPAALGVASAGVSTEASRADHVHALPTIPAVSSATPQPIGTATAGVSDDAARADHVHAGTPGAIVTEPMTGTGWTTTPIVGTAVTATWASGKLSLSAPSGSSALSAVTRDVTPLDARATQWDVAARVQVTAGDGTTPQGQLILEWHESVGNSFRVALISDRKILCASDVGASYADHGLAYGLSSGETTGGQLWLRLTRLEDGRIAAWWGVGVAGALPTAWTRTHLVDRAELTAAVSSQATIRIYSGYYGAGPLGATWTVDVLDIRTSWSGQL